MKRPTILALLLLSFALSGWGQSGNGPRVVNDDDLVQLNGNVHSQAQPQFDRGPTNSSMPMERMILVLGLRPGAQAELDGLLAQQHDPASPLYHQWLTPDEFGRRFGINDDDLDSVRQWLLRRGFSIDEVGASRAWINFSGDVARVQQAFRTHIHDFMVDGELHHANADAPSIPRGLTDIVYGIVSLHDFRKKSMHGAGPQPVNPQFTSGSSHYLAPADFATLYNLNTLYGAGTNGTGQSIAIVGRTEILLSDVQTFRSYFGLPVNNPVFVFNGTHPGNVGGNEETEADLDVQWSGATAPNATVKFVISKSTQTTDGVDLSAQYIVNNTVAPVMSTSFGLCEQDLGSSGNSFYANLWAQAAAQGITSFVSSGDSGAAGCDGGNATKAQRGLAVNGLCSPPNSVCVGGTQFNDTSNPALYWSASNDPTTKKSVLGVIPEIAWNESGAVAGGSGLWSTGGGVSTLYAKPSWQVAPGVPADAKRDVPDVSLSAAGHDGYLMFQGGSLFSVGGTSASSPAFAGLMALIVQKTGSSQGNANTVFYPMGNAQYGSAGTAVFRDITSGSNIVPKFPTGTLGYSTTTAYDLVTGLGSVDGASLVNNWGGVPVVDFTIGASPTGVTVQQGASGTSTITTTISGGFNSAVALSASGQPAGVTVGFSPTPIAAPGSGTSTMTMTVGAAAALGTTTITITATGGGKTHTATVDLTVVPPPDFSLSANPTSLTVAQGASGPSTITSTIVGSFNAAVALSATGMPSGVTVAFVPSSIAAPGSGTSTMTVTAAANATLGNSTITITGTGGGKTHTTTVSLTVVVPPDFSLSANPTTLTLTQGTSGPSTITSAIVGTFNAAVALSASGMPSGVTVAFSPTSIAAPGSGTSTMTVTAAANATVGGATITVTGTGGGKTHTTSVSLTVNAASSSPGLIPQSGWTLKYVDSAGTCASAGGANAFDGNPGTIWHTEWCTTTAQPPHEIQIDLGANYSLTEFHYLPRQDGNLNGNIKQYEFYVSADGINWGTPVATGNLCTTGAINERQVTFPAAAGRFIRLRELSDYLGTPYANAAEINVVGILITGGGPFVQNVTLNPATVVGGNTSQGTVTLSGAAPAGGAVVTLSSSNTAVATVPANVTVPEGNTSANFTVTTVSVSSTATSTISGTYGGGPIGATLTVTAANSGGLVSQAGWTLLYVDSQETVCSPTAAVNAFDGNPNTMWHTQWCGGSPPPPHEIQIDMGASYSLTGFHYLPRQDGGFNGNIKQYEFYVSADGVNWGSPVATGILSTGSGDTTEKQVSFPTTVGRFIRLRALNEINGAAYTNVAELNVVGTPAGGGGPPVLQSVGLNPASVVGGNPSQGTVTLTAPAPAGGAVVTLSSSNTAVATVPASVTVLEGNLTANFTVTTVSVGSTATSNISGTYGGAPIVALLTVSPPGVNLVPRTAWTLKFVDSAGTCASAGGANAFDGNPGTIWHTEWCTSTPPPPHEIQIDMSASYTLIGFRYLPRQDGNLNGNIKQYEFYVSADGVNWGVPVATGNLCTTSDASERQVTFPAATGRYIRLREISDLLGTAYANAAEINAIQQ